MFGLGTQSSNSNNRNNKKESTTSTLHKHATNILNK